MEPRVRNLLLDSTLAPPQQQREDGVEFIQLAPIPIPRLHSDLGPDFSSDVRHTDELPRLREIGGSDGQYAWTKPHQEPSDYLTQSKRTTKSAVPLAEVLNDNSAQAQNGEQERDLQNGDQRKRRRLDADTTRTLPKPSPSARKGSKRQRMPALLPPLLPPLHNPPADARIFPSMNPQGFLTTFQDLPSPLPIPTPDREATSTQVSASAEQEASVAAKKGKEKGKGKGKGKKKWSEEETAHLLQGVARFGIGSWKKILQHADYNFNNRTAVDLKDRFRTCCPDEYRKSGSARGTVESILDDTTPENGTLEGKRLSASRKGPEELAKLGISGPFPKRSRRQRREFTKAEDDSLLRGFIKHGAQWKKIQCDPSLILEHRSRTDLRDRFRNRYPQRFKEAGYMHRAKHPTEGEDDQSKDANTGHSNPVPSSSSRPAVEELDFSNLLLSSGSVLEPRPSGSKDDTQHSFRLHTSDPYASEFPRLSPDDDDDGGIRLSRTIFDWADQNSRAIKDSAQADAEPKTLSRLDQFHINPLVAQQKLPTYPSLHANPPTFSLSKILNEPLSRSVPPQYESHDTGSKRNES